MQVIKPVCNFSPTCSLEGQQSILKISTLAAITVLNMRKPLAVTQARYHLGLGHRLLGPGTAFYGNLLNCYPYHSSKPEFPTVYGRPPYGIGRSLNKLLNRLRVFSVCSDPAGAHRSPSVSWALHIKIRCKAVQSTGNTTGKHTATKCAVAGRATERCVDL